jgi:hypothetical protein
MKKSVSSILGLLTAVLVSTSVQAGLIVYEDFSYPAGAPVGNDASHGYNLTTAGGVNGVPYDTVGTTNTTGGSDFTSVIGTYIGQNTTNSPATGLRGTWGGTMVSPGLTYVQGTKTLVTAGGANKHVTTSQWQDGAFVYRNSGAETLFGGPDDEIVVDGYTNYWAWDSAYTTSSARPLGANGTVLYFSFLMQVNDLTKRAWTAWKAGNNQNLYIGVDNLATNLWTVFYDNNGGPGAYTSGSVPATTNVTLFVGKYTFIGGPNDTNNLFEVWVNPTLGQALPATPDLKVVGCTNVNANLRQWSTRVNADGTGGDNLTWDEVRVGTTLADVTPYTEALPEGLVVYEPFAYPLGAPVGNDASHGYNLTTAGGVNGAPYDLNATITNLFYSYVGSYAGAYSSNSPGTGLRGTWAGAVVPGLTYAQGSTALVTSSNALNHSSTSEWLDGAFIYRNSGTTIDPGFGGPDDEITVDGWLPYLNYDAAYTTSSARPLGKPGTVLYFSALMKVNDTSTKALTAWKAGNNQNLYIGITADGDPNWKVSADNNGNAAAVVITGSVPATTNVTLFVGRWTFTGGPNDTNNLFEVWVNPALGAGLGTPDLTCTGVTNVNSNLRQWSTRCSPSTAGNLTWDEVRVGTSLAAVTPTTTVATPPTITVSRSGSTVTLSWGATGWVLQSQTKLLSQGLGTTGWVDVSPSTASLTSTNLTIDGGSEAVFYRLRQAP